MARVRTDTIHPFARGSLTASGAQYSTLVTGVGDTFTAVETVYIEGPDDELGSILEYEFGLTGSFQSSASTEGVNFKWQARNFGDDTWVDVSPAATIAANASVLAEHTRSGYVAAQTNLNRPQIEVRCVIKSAATGAETAAGKTKNSSYVRIIYGG